MLLLGDAPASPADLGELVNGSGCTRLAAATAAFLSSAGGTAPVNQPSLCLLQGEQATLHCPRELGLLVGSQDATTCLVTVVACRATGIVWAAHVDQPLGERDVAALSVALQQMGERPQLYLAGGYCDAKGAGPRLAAAFLQLLHSLETTIALQLCCVGRANTTPAGAPRSRQLLLDTATWTPRAWLCADRGPEVARRFAAQHCRRDPRCTLVPVWDSHGQQLVLAPFDPSCVDSWEVAALEQMLGWPDTRLLQAMSTSPEHEPDWFVQDMRSMMAFLIAAQEPHSPERQEAAAASTYSLSGSAAWQRVQQQESAAAAAATGP